VDLVYAVDVVNSFCAAEIVDTAFWCKIINSVTILGLQYIIVKVMQQKINRWNK
jgi:hypothetical protein